MATQQKTIRPKLSRSKVVGLGLKFLVLEEGFNFREAGQALDRSRARAQQIARRNKVYVRKGRTARGWAMALGVPELATAEWLLNQKGKGLDRIAKYLGIDFNTLKKQIRRLGLNPEDFQKKPKVIQLACDCGCGGNFTRRTYYVRGRLHFKDNAHKGRWLGLHYGSKTKFKKRVIVF